MLISVIIPCYRSENTLEEVVCGLIQVIELSGYDYEIILVSDASPDNVFSVIERLAAMNNRITGLELARNFGQHAALMAGYRVCTGDIVVTMDDDGQTPAESFFSLVDAILAGADVAFAHFPQKKISRFRRFGTSINNLAMTLLLDKPRELQLGTFFACKRFIIQEIVRYPHAFPHLGGLILRSTNKVVNIPIEKKQRISGKSGYTLKKMINLWVNGFTAFSVKPLRFSSCIGALSAFIGFIFAARTIMFKLLNPSIQAGYSSLMSILLIIGGLILLSLGLIGEYVGRIYIAINNAPQYVIRKTTPRGEMYSSDRSMDSVKEQELSDR